MPSSRLSDKQSSKREKRTQKERPPRPRPPQPRPPPRPELDQPEEVVGGPDSRGSPWTSSDHSSPSTTSETTRTTGEPIRPVQQPIRPDQQPIRPDRQPIRTTRGSAQSRQRPIRHVHPEPTRPGPPLHNRDPTQPTRFVRRHSIRATSVQIPTRAATSSLRPRTNRSGFRSNLRTRPQGAHSLQWESSQ